MTGRRARIVRRSRPDYRSHTMPELIAIAGRRADGMIRVVHEGRERIIVGPQYLPTPSRRGLARRIFGAGPSR